MGEIRHLQVFTNIYLILSDSFTCADFSNILFIKFCSKHSSNTVLLCLLQNLIHIIRQIFLEFFEKLQEPRTQMVN